MERDSSFHITPPGLEYKEMGFGISMNKIFLYHEYYTIYYDL